jgi:hypothetical protein
MNKGLSGVQQAGGPMTRMTIGGPLEGSSCIIFLYTNMWHLGQELGVVRTCTMFKKHHHYEKC